MNKTVREVYFSRNPFTEPEHYHDCHQILYIKKGMAEFTVSGRTRIVGEGCMMVISRYEHHFVKAISEDYQRYVLKINPFSASVPAVFSLLFNRPKGFDNLFDLIDFRQEAEYLLDRMILEEVSKKPLGDEMLELLVTEFLICVYRRYPERFSALENSDFAIVLQIQRRFEEDFKENYSLGNIAKEYGISASSLSHKFKDVTGVSVMEYLKLCRIAGAKNYLATTAMSIGEIVEACGFGDASNFSRTFREQNGLSPKEFRRIVNNE